MFDFYIESKKEVDAKREKMKSNFMAIYAMMINDPATKDYEKVLLKRTALFYNGLSREETYAFCMETPDEMNAKELAKYINEDDEYGAEIESMREDHYTYIYVFQGCRDNKTKEKAIENRKKAIIMNKESEIMSPEQGMQSNANT